MLRRYKKESGGSRVIDRDLLKDTCDPDYKSFTITDYFKFMFFCTLLIIPVYAIAESVINQNWIMVIIDVLLVPVAFVHGLLMLFGIID